ncbi:MAG TPA: dATP/dGTP diphosphohydrolase domain-containing protein [Protaetiibacter sp.]|nr:dATP/dGTP diphosphohydrolase domain-containing protein [Protaetiibacter sp.]
MTTHTDPTEVRVTASTGASKGQKLARFDLIPSGPLRLLAEHYGRGAEKYPRVGDVDNWRLGYPYSSSIAALHRHLNAFTAGEDIDEETGSPHLVSVAWHAFTLLEYMRVPGFAEVFDDRQDTKLAPPGATPQSVRDAITARGGEMPAADRSAS